MSRAYIQRWRRWWYQKGGCSAGKISMDCECVDWACLCMYVSRFACVFVCCCDFFSLPIRSLLRLYPFNSIIQWCTSRINGKRAHAHTHTHTHAHTYTLAHSYVCTIQRHAPYSKHFYLCCSSIYDDYCLFLLYYYCQSFMESKKKTERKIKRSALAYDSCFWIWYARCFAVLGLNKEPTVYISTYT